MSGKTDIMVGSTSDTLEKAKFVGFTDPYFVFKFQVISKKSSGIKDFSDLKNVKVGTALGTTHETEYLAYVKKIIWAQKIILHFKVKTRYSLVCTKIK
nr:transporter substrate-binding domain-containing protein [Pseudoalteromonas sp. NBT06-2]